MSHAVVVQSAERLGAERERNAVVAWFRERADAVSKTLPEGETNTIMMFLLNEANLIERGDHLR